MILKLKLAKSDVIERNNSIEKKKEVVSEWINFMKEKEKCNPNLDCTLEIEIYS